MRIHSSSSSSSSSGWRIVVVVLLILFCEGVVGQDVCSCTPTVYRCQLDLNRTCDPINTDFGPSTGVAEASCQIDRDATNNTEKVVLMRVTNQQLPWHHRCLPRNIPPHHRAPRHPIHQACCHPVRLLLRQPPHPALLHRLHRLQLRLTQARRRPCHRTPIA